MLESTLEAALSSGDIPELKSTQDIDKYADSIVTAVSTAVDKAIPTSKSGRPESQPVLDETLLIKEKRRFRRQYSQAHSLILSGTYSHFSFFQDITSLHIKFPFLVVLDVNEVISMTVDSTLTCI